MNRLYAFGLILVVAAAAHAGMQVKILVENTAHQSGFAGGAFLAESVGAMPLPETSFLTFCLESDEYVANGGTYWVEIATAASFGGAGGPSPDPLDPRTAFLYHTFQTDPGALNAHLSGTASFTGTPAELRAATRQLQEAIWCIEEEANGVANGLVGFAADKWGDIGAVRVMQLWTHPTLRTGEYKAQDQLISIPAPAAALLGLIGLGTAAWTKRRMA